MKMHHKTKQKYFIIQIVVHYILFDVNLKNKWNSFTVTNVWTVRFRTMHLHLADAFFQSDLQCIQVIHFFQYVCVPWELNPRPFALLMQCSTPEPQEHAWWPHDFKTEPPTEWTRPSSLEEMGKVWVHFPLQQACQYPWSQHLCSKRSRGNRRPRARDEANSETQHSAPF